MSPSTRTRARRADDRSAQGHPVDHDIGVAVYDLPGRVGRDGLRELPVPGRVAEIVGVVGHAPAEHDVRAWMAERVDPLRYVAQVGLIEIGRTLLRVGGHDLEVVGGVVGDLEAGEVVGWEYQQRARRRMSV